MKSLLVLFAVLSLVACATERQYQSNLEALQGIDELSLIRQWGPPDQIYESSGHRFFVYRSRSTAVMPGTEPMYQTRVVGNTAYTQGYGGYPATLVDLACTTTFELVDGKVSSFSFRGNDCKSN